MHRINNQLDCLIKMLKVAEHARVRHVIIGGFIADGFIFVSDVRRNVDRRDLYNLSTNLRD